MSIKHSLVRGAALKAPLPAVFWWLFAGTLLNRLGILVPSFLSLFLAAESHTPATTIGVLVGVWGTGSVLGALGGGALADRTGPRGAIVTSQALALVACAALAGVHAPQALGAAAFLAGCASTVHKPAGAVIVARTIKESEHVRAFGLLYWASNIGAAVSPSVSGFLLESSGYWLIALNVITATAYATIAFRLPGAQPSTAGVTAAKGPESLSGLVAPFRTPATARFLLLSFCLAAIYLQKQSALALDMQAHGLTPHTYGLVISLNGFLIIAAQPLVSRWARRLNVDTQFLLAAALVAVGFGANAVAGQPWTYAAALVVWTAGEILLVPQASAFLVRHAPQGRTGSYQGAYHFVWNLGLVLGAPIGVTVLHTWGSVTLWTGALALGLSVAAVHTVSSLRDRRRRTVPPGASGEFRA
ncbi:MFS transporter [Streptomyces sp. HC307]|uniref:MFS transporter n=1 Tax=Streptomyces flavusporus TaxID=3385496 RepID=UPI0039174BFC